MEEVAYEIKKSNGESVIIPESEIDYSQFSIGLIGHGQPEYGPTQNQNFLQMLENFANDSAPEVPTVGQLWYKTSENTLYIYAKVGDIEGWIPLLKKNTTPTEPAGSTSGDLWFNSSTEKLEVYNGSEWIVVGPIATDDVERVSPTPCIEIVPAQKVSEYTVSTNYFSKEGLYLVKLNILATEHGESGSNECSCWCYKILIQTYKDISNALVTEIIGSPSYELIAATDYATWNIVLDYDNGLKIIFDKGKTGGGNIRVTYDIEIVKNNEREVQ